MKTKTITAILLLIAAVMIGSHSASSARGQMGNSLAWIPYLSLEQVDDGTGNLVPTVRISGANLQVVNGTGSTSTVNAAGNLIVGYNETGNRNGDVRTGSHNIVGGSASSHTSYGGLIVGSENTITGPFNSISGGHINTTSSFGSSVSGGLQNTASARWCSVTGGSYNTATAGDGASVTGGSRNTANHVNATVSGGANRTASDFEDWRAGSLFEDD